MIEVLKKENLDIAPDINDFGIDVSTRLFLDLSDPPSINEIINALKSDKIDKETYHKLKTFKAQMDKYLYLFKDYLGHLDYSA